MEFNKTIMNHMECFISDCGNYKVIKYGTWGAYFKPPGQKPFGNSCKLEKGSSKRYQNQYSAQRDCRKHFNKYGSNPGAFDRI